MPEIVLSGLRPTGRVHLGNYFGAVKNWVDLEKSGRYRCFFFVADLHALTTDYADTMLVLDLPTQTWKKPVPLPYGARGQGVCSNNGLLYVAGGYDGKTRKDFFLWMGEDAN